MIIQTFMKMCNITLVNVLKVNGSGRYILTLHRKKIEKQHVFYI